ncbi:hypothetical protein, partial [Micromonospora sp. NPDC005367]|uniref:hypothetical protein n=1 Tax=Micromonospora sp. NPDC005367 TaxID=3155590 RepID=UPI0033A4C247
DPRRAGRPRPAARPRRSWWPPTEVTASDLPGPRWQVAQWFGPRTTHTPSGSPLWCTDCADAELRASYGRR